MGESSICSIDTEKAPGGDVSLLFQRRIQFIPSTKHFHGFSNNNPNFYLETLNPSTSDYAQRLPPLSSTFSSPGKKPDTGEHGFDPELCFGITVVQRIGAGLQNLGNTCFLNSVLQCLTYTEPFAAYIQSGMHKSSCHTAGFCAMCAIQNHVKRALQSTGRIVAPKDLVMNLRCISRNFRNARQEDAHEYMVNLLESMHRCCLPSGVPSESPSAYEKSLVHKIFGGRLRSQVKCMQCSHCSNTFDPFLDLSLEITKADSLRKALTHFTAVEQLDGGERHYQCQRCKQKVKALKQLTVYKAPNVLSIHLKRFGSHVPGQKIDKRVEFGPTLDLKPFVSGSYEGDLKYILYGVLVHAGWSTHSGHYYCFVRTSKGMWHSLDDNRVVQVSEKTVLQQKAYMLFYVRDRKNLAPKKPIDTKENASITKNGESWASIKPKALQNGPIVTNLHTSESVVKPQLKESSIVKVTAALATAEDSSILKEPMSQSSSKTIVKGLGVKQSTIGQPVEELAPQSTPSYVENSNPTSYPSIAAKGSQKNLECLHQASNPHAVFSSCSGSQNFGLKECVTNKGTIHMNDIATIKIMPREESQKKFNDLKHDKNQPDPRNKQNECKEVSSHQLCHKAAANSLIPEEGRLAELPVKLCNRNECIQKDAFGHHHSLQKVLKPKKVGNLRIASMHLSSRRLIKASRSLYKKKQKRSKKRSLRLETHIQGNFEEDSNSRGLEPSTSEKTRMSDLVSSHSERRHIKSTPEKASGPRDVKHAHIFKAEAVSNVIEGDLKERIHKNNAVLASNEQPRSFSSISEEKQSDTRERETSQEERGLFENGLISMRTRGLEETTVASWDEMESSSRQRLGSLDGQSISIGYVADEWDEEYDRGKRKKVRQHIDDTFGEPNPFQEIATKKAKLNNAKVDRNSFGHKPLRISPRR